MGREFLYIALPIILFIANLIILGLLRLNDSHSKTGQVIKKMGERITGEYTKAQELAQNEKQKVEEAMQTARDQTNELIDRIRAQKNDLQDYSNDFEQLKTILENYKSAITQLSDSTSAVESRITSTRKDIEKLQSFTKIIDDHKQDVLEQINTFESYKEDTNQYFEKVTGELKKSLDLFSDDMALRISGQKEDYDVLRHDAEVFLEEKKVQLDAQYRSMEAAIDARKLQLSDEISKAKDELGRMELSLSDSLQNAKNDLESRIQEADGHFDELSEKLDARENDAVSHIDSRVQDAEGSFDSLSKNLDAREKDAVTQLDESFGQIKLKTKELDERTCDSLDAYARSTEKKLFTTFDDVLLRLDSSFRNMIRILSEYISDVEDKALQLDKDNLADPSITESLISSVSGLENHLESFGNVLSDMKRSTEEPEEDTDGTIEMTVDIEVTEEPEENCDSEDTGYEPLGDLDSDEAPEDEEEAEEKQDDSEETEEPEENCDSEDTEEPEENCDSEEETEELEDSDYEPDGDLDSDEESDSDKKKKSGFSDEDDVDIEVLEWDDI